MTHSRYIQVHAVIEYTAALLNRDDSGLAKRLLFGGYNRTRVSSQCIKHHIRMDDGPYSLKNIAPDPHRTKELTERAVMTRAIAILNGQDLQEEVQARVIEALNINLYGKDGNDPNKRQALLFGQPEIEYLASRVAEILQEDPDPDTAVQAVNRMFTANGDKQNFSAFRNAVELPAGLIGIMFGRMVTSDPDANIEAAVSMAHAFTVHPEESEVDYFTAMEDLSGNQPGAAHIGLTEINSGIYYLYACVDVPTLVSNATGRSPDKWLEADRDVAAQAAANLVGLMATVSPGAKKGSTAPFAYADGIIVEIGERQPRNLSGAYRVPAEPQMDDAKDKLLEAISKCDQRYGTHEVRRMLGFEKQDASQTPETLESLTTWVRESVLRGEAS